MFRIIIFMLVILFLCSCGEKAPDNTKKELTQHQRDSVLAESDLPGAKAVGKAIAVSDSAATRTDKINEHAK